MIHRQHRFRGQKAIDYVYRSSRPVRLDQLSMRATPSKRPDYRLAIVVSKKVSKSAVVRNRIRRRLYEQVRLIRKEMAEPLKLDILLSVYDESIAKIPAAELDKLCRELLKKRLEKAK